MKLIDWMKTEGIDDQQLAERLSALSSDPEKTTSASAVKKWKYGERVPRADEMKGIHALSHGAVAPNDFYEIEISASSS